MSLREQVLTLARGAIGIPYVWGGATPGGFDCSGLVQWIMARVGVQLPRTAQLQWNATDRVSRSELKPGDLLFFANTYKNDPNEPITHVGIYVGDGKMINAPSEGDRVRVMDAFTGFWGNHYAGAGRPAAFAREDGGPPSDEPSDIPGGSGSVGSAPRTPSNPYDTRISTINALGVQLPDFTDPDLWQRSLLVIMGALLVVGGAYLALTG